MNNNKNKTTVKTFNQEHSKKLVNQKNKVKLINKNIRILSIHYLSIFSYSFERIGCISRILRKVILNTC